MGILKWLDKSLLSWLKRWLYGLPDENDMSKLTHEERIERLREQVRK